jgi:lipopolysaccharide transport system permease protein
MLNPMTGIIESFRRVMLQGVAPDFQSLGVAFIASIVLLALSYVYFKRVEATIADVI